MISGAMAAALLLAATVSPARESGGSPFPAAGTGLLPLARGPVIIFHAPADTGLAEELARRAESLHLRIRRDLALRSTVTVGVVLLSRRVNEETARLWNTRLRDWMAAAAYSADNLIILRYRPGQPPRDLGPVMAHELTHVILKEDFPGWAAWPVWFQEGLAMRESGTEGFRQFAVLSTAAIRSRLIPLERLWTGFPGEEDQARLAYAESFSFLSFLQTEFGRARFVEFLDALRTREFTQAFNRVYGIGPGAMEKEWLDQMVRRHKWIPILTGGAAFWTLSLMVFFVALGVRRRRTRRIHEKWEAEGDYF